MKVVDMEFDHPFHPANKLTYYEKVEKESLVCAACLDEIPSEHYGCGECNFFLHLSCAQRPSELTHSLHPLHPLTLTLVPRTSLLQCMFAFPGGLKLNHVCHAHILTLEKVVKKADKGIVCAACLGEISGRSAEHYCCRKCNFSIHKSCSEAPLELTHSSHALHPLRLIPHNPDYWNKHERCDACYDLSKGFLYNCGECKFTLHATCALPDMKPDYSDFPGGLKLNHVCHTHILTLEKVVKKADKGIVCAACVEEISGPLADYYSCRKCNCFLHKLCAERPREFTHPLHPQHTLSLLPREFYQEQLLICFECQKQTKGFVYACLHFLEFHIDFKCSFPKLERRIQNLEQVHHHPLIFIPRTSKFSCDLCSSEGNEGEEEQSYACSTCDYLVHKSCALNTLARHYKNDEHCRSLVQGVPEDLQIYGAFYCDACHKVVSPEDSVSYCAHCRSFVHINCLITGETGLITDIKDAIDYLEGSLIQLVLNGEEFVKWPQRNISSELIQPYLLGKNDVVMGVQPMIRHCHKQHDLILFQELLVNNDSFFEEEDEEILCDGCIHPISAPYYCCQECNYYLHSACANLPNHIEHFSHSHELKLVVLGEFYKAFLCNRCECFSNGFIYKCESCDFNLDLTCAALPAGIMHETHEHPLFQMEFENDGVCYACGYNTEISALIFKCRSCDIHLCYDCAMYSRSIRHRWDRQHPLDLRFPPHGDHPDHFMCDMCEELIHPMRWLYSCFKCEVSLHTNCAPRYQLCPNIKFGGEVRILSHPHLVKYYRKATLKIKCDKCEGDGDSPVFECETCYYCICYACGFEELDESNSDSSAQETWEELL